MSSVPNQVQMLHRHVCVYLLVLCCLSRVSAAVWQLQHPPECVSDWLQLSPHPLQIQGGNRVPQHWNPFYLHPGTAHYPSGSLFILSVSFLGAPGLWESWEMWESERT